MSARDLARSTLSRCIRAGLLTLAGTFAIGALHADVALGNGAFPASGQVLVHPADPDVAWVNTSYGFARTTDGGATFALACEAGIGYAGGFHPHAGLTTQGTLFMGLPDGLAVGRADACSFERAPEVEGHFVADVSLDPTGRAVVLAVPPNGDDPRVLASTDDLATLTPLGVPLPKKLTVLTLDADPLEPDTIYVSAILDANPPIGVLVRSFDAGATWTTLLVPSSDAEHGPFIGGLDPTQAGRVFVRLNGAPGRLLMSEDYGETYEELVEIEGFLHAFRLTPDGASIYYGGTLHGLSIMDLETRTPTQLSALPTRCVTIAGDRTFACFDQLAAGFAVGVATTERPTFEPWLNQACIDALLPCGEATPVIEACAPSWPMVQQQLDATGSCEGGGGASASSSSSTASTMSTNAGGAGASSASGAGADGAGGSPGADADGCGSCGVGRPPESSGSLAALLALSVLFARRSNRGTSIAC